MPGSSDPAADSRPIFAMLLHAHLPYVRHPEHERFFEEDWLHEAVVESYVPLTEAFRQWERLGIRRALTFSVSPSLAAMLSDPLLRSRTARHIDGLCALSAAETARTAGSGSEHEAARFYSERLHAVRRFWQVELQCDLLGEWARLAAVGVFELATTAATHGFLPLLASQPSAVRAQVLTARDEHRRCFGVEPAGFWLPECAYVPGLESTLAEGNLRWFVVDAHGLLHGQPRPVFSLYRPVYTVAGPAAFGRDHHASRPVWSADFGYPGHPDYRDFYRDAGFDLPEEQVRAFFAPGAQRKFTGLKYRRITGPTEHKDWYNPQAAARRADEHASHYLGERIGKMRELAELLPVQPVVVAPFDAELFGHWWFEGPQFLDLFVRKAWFDQDTFRLGTPGGFLRRNASAQVAAPAASSWGQHGYWEVWVNDKNWWIYPHLHAAGERMHRAAEKAVSDPPERGDVSDRCLRQMMRELLLAQASDWAFLIHTGTAPDYAAQRTRTHLLRFNRLWEGLAVGRVDETLLADCEWRSPLFPGADWRYYADATG